MGSELGEAWFVCGPPGVGKSTLGRALARDVEASLLDRDTLIEPLIGVVHTLLGLDPADLDAARSRAALGDAPYRTLFDTARDNIVIGGRVVLVAPFTRWLADPDLVARLPELVGTRAIRVVDAWCPNPVRVDRLRSRGADRDARRLTALAAMDPSGLPGDEWHPAPPHVRVDTTRSPQQQLADARRAPLLE